MYHRNKRTALVALSIGAFVVTGCSSKQSVDAQSSATPVAAAVEVSASVTPLGLQSADGVTTQTTSQPAAALPSSDGEQPGTRIVVTDLKRSSNIVSLRLTMYNDSSADFAMGDRLNASGYAGYRNVSGIHLIDTPSKKKYFVIADTDRKCLCSEDIEDVPAKAAASLWAKFPAPPDSVKKITVEVPHFAPVEDVSISQ